MYKPNWVVGALVLLLLGAGCVPEQEQLQPNPWRIAEGERPLVIGHGGAKVLFPENTMVAFEGADSLAVDVLEMDVAITADGVLVTHHDLTIDRTSDGQGEVAAYTFEELQAFNFGAKFTDPGGEMPYASRPVRLPSVEEVMQRFPDYPMVIELKDREARGREAAEALYELIQRFDRADRTVVASFSDEVLEHFAEISGNAIPFSSGRDETEDFVFSGLTGMAFLYAPDAALVQIPMREAGINLATKRVIRSAHRRDMAVHYWTINEPEEMRQLIELGADGLITDRPDLMWEVLQEMGW